MIEVNGSYGEGGGQVFRTSIGLSALTGKPCRISNIRKGRCKSGLAEQHLQALNALAQICDAEVVGGELHSENVTFIPKKIKSGDYKIKISTAGSVGLTLQALLIPAVDADLNIIIEGGATYGKWAAPVDSFKYVLMPLLNRLGFDASIDILKEGFFPKGGALVGVKTKKSNLKPFDFTNKGNLIKICGVSVASKMLEKAEVAGRQAKAAKKYLGETFSEDIKIEDSYSDSLCPGSGIQLWAEYENTVIGGNNIGERGKKSEYVGIEAAKNLLEELNKGVVDSNNADQLLPYLAIAEGGSIVTSEITGHIKTNAYVIEKFLPVKFKIKENRITCSKVS